MKSENIELLELRQRIDDYSPDDPEATFPYSARLARDNDWSPAYAQRVLEEYRRFAYLAMAAGHPVTPSDEVDQAWHLHMIYTRSYWTDFCEGVLGAPLHHSPTKGSNEQRKFVDWYERTLESYRRLFDAEPPADIWPPATRRFGADTRFRRVNAERNWVLRKPLWWRWLGSRLRIPKLPSRRVVAAVIALAISVALVGCQHLVGARLLASGISGTEFIGLFLALGALGIILAAIVRSSLRNTGNRPLQPLDSYTASYLAGGSSRLLDAVVVKLVHTKLLGFDKKKATLSRTDSPPDALHPFEQAIYNLVPPSPATAKVADLRRSTRHLFSPVRDALRESGLLLTSAEAIRATLWPLLIAFIVPTIGAMRILHGLNREKPVGILCILTVLTGVVALGVFGSRAWRSRAGDRTVRQLQREYSALRRCLIGADIPVAVGLFGVTCLQGTAFADLAPTPTPKHNNSGCGGGGGDGGGDGCGAGGCGGCGGCGG